MGKTKSAAPNMEVHSASKKPLLSKYRSDIVQLEQEMSQHPTLGHTPSQLNTTPPPCRSSAKRRKISDPFKSTEKQSKAPQQSDIEREGRELALAELK